MSQISENYQQALLRARSERARHVAAWRESALTQAAYCAQHRLNATTFNGWLHHKSAQRLAPADAADATDATDSSVVLPLKAPSRTSASALSTSPPTVIALNAPSSRRASAPLSPSSPSSPPSPSASSPEPSTLIGPGGWRIELGSLANVARLFTMLDQHNVEAANGANGAKSTNGARSANTSKLSNPVRGL